MDNLWMIFFIVAILIGAYFCIPKPRTLIDDLDKFLKDIGDDDVV